MHFKNVCQLRVYAIASISGLVNGWLFRKAAPNGLRSETRLFEIQIVQGAADLTKGLRANMRVHFDRLRVTVSVVLLLECPNGV